MRIDLFTIIVGWVLLKTFTGKKFVPGGGIAQSPGSGYKGETQFDGSGLTQEHFTDKFSQG